MPQPANPYVDASVLPATTPSDARSGFRTAKCPRSTRLDNRIHCLALIAVLTLKLCRPAAASEHIVNGDFGGLSGWDQVQEAKLLEPNSAFKECYPDNGKSAFLSGPNSDGNRRYLTQKFPQLEGKIQWQFDFLLAQDGDPKDASWIVVLEGGGRPACYTYISGRRVGVLGETDQKQGGAPLVFNTWYHFAAEIDLGSKTISWRYVTEGGDEGPVENVQIQERFNGNAVDAVTIRENVVAGVTPCSLTIDNISVRKMP